VRNRRWELDLFEIGTGEFITSFTPVYGLLYNGYVAYEINYGIAADGWHVATHNDWRDLVYYLDPSRIGLDPFPSVAGGEIKETGLIYWDTPNTGATNSVGFNGRGSGIRGSAGGFSALKSNGYFWGIASGYYLLLTLAYNNVNLNFTVITNKYGVPIRLVKNSTTLTHGQTGTYTGNDLKVYPTICIGTQEWLACNLCETKFTNGETIPVVEDNDEWAALTTEACCAYDNDWSNAFEYTEETADSTDITADTTLTTSDTTITI
jgi:uncharacterized protein (TIGR02145 family)